LRKAALIWTGALIAAVGGLVAGAAFTGDFIWP
jgi:hypothetical protein